MGKLIFGESIFSWAPLDLVPCDSVSHWTRTCRCHSCKTKSCQSLINQDWRNFPISDETQNKTPNWAKMSSLDGCAKETRRVKSARVLRCNFSQMTVAFLSSPSASTVHTGTRDDLFLFIYLLFSTIIGHEKVICHEVGEDRRNISLAIVFSLQQRAGKELCWIH